jgi:hypothetical protein
LESCSWICIGFGRKYPCAPKGNFLPPRRGRGLTTSARSRPPARKRAFPSRSIPFSLLISSLSCCYLDVLDLTVTQVFQSSLDIHLYFNVTLISRLASKTNTLSFSISNISTRFDSCSRTFFLFDHKRDLLGVTLRNEDQNDRKMVQDTIVGDDEDVGPLVSIDIANRTSPSTQEKF